MGVRSRPEKPSLIETVCPDWLCFVVMRARVVMLDQVSTRERVNWVDWVDR